MCRSSSAPIAAALKEFSLCNRNVWRWRYKEWLSLPIIESMHCWSDRASEESICEYGHCALVENMFMCRISELWFMWMLVKYASYFVPSSPSVSSAPQACLCFPSGWIICTRSLSSGLQRASTVNTPASRTSWRSIQRPSMWLTLYWIILLPKTGRWVLTWSKCTELTWGK